MVKVKGRQIVTQYNQVTISAIQKCYALGRPILELGNGSVQTVKVQVEYRDTEEALFIEQKFGPDDL